MGCRSDYMNPTEQEKEARLVARLTRVLYAFVRETEGGGEADPPGLLEASQDMYANGESVHDLTAQLCGKLRSLSPQTMQALHNDARPDVISVCEWWDRHQGFDRKRAQKATSTLEEVKAVLTRTEYDLSEEDALARIQEIVGGK